MKIKLSKTLAVVLALCLTFAGFSAFAAEVAIERIQNSCLKEMIVTNTINIAPEKRIDKVKVLSVGQLLGHGILRILSDEPLSGLFTYSYDKSKRDLL